MLRLGLAEGAISSSFRQVRGIDLMVLSHRICIGLNIANQALFIDVASTLWAASIEPALDDFGNEILPNRNESVDEGLVVYVLYLVFFCGRMEVLRSSL